MGWKLDGPYAAEIEGANGRNGIPLLNFFGWIVLVAVVVFLCQSLTQTQEAENDRRPRKQSGIERSVAMLLPYYLVSAIWAIKKRNPKYLLYSIVFPTTLLPALWNR